MSDPEDPSPTGEPVADYENPSPAVENDDDADVPQLEEQDIPEDPDSVDLEEEKHTVDATVVEASAQNGDISEITSADASSIDAIPRRAGSPIESVTSAAGDSPSVQVRDALSMIRPEKCLTGIGLARFLSKQQCVANSCLTLRARQPDAVLPTL